MKMRFLLERGDPAATVRTYLSAIRSGDFDKAASLCTEEWQKAEFVAEGGEKSSISLRDTLSIERDLDKLAVFEIDSVSYIGSGVFAEVKLTARSGSNRSITLMRDESNGGWVIQYEVFQVSRSGVPDQ